MKLKIGEPRLVQLTKELYKISVDFMEGDADGNEVAYIYFTQDQLEDKDFNKELELFLKTMTSACEKDSHGRGGYDDFENMIEDHYKDSDIYRFFPDYASEEQEVIPFKELLIEWPTDSQGEYFHSVSEISISFYDKDGIEHSVTIEKD